MILTDKKYKRYLLAAFSGLLMGFTVIFPQIGIFAWIALIPFALAFFKKVSSTELKKRELFMLGAVFYYCYYVVVLHWFLYMYPLEFIDGMTPLVALVIVLLAGLGLPLVHSLLGGLVLLFSAALTRISFIKERKALYPLALAIPMVVFEWTQILTFVGMPTGRLAMSQTRMVAGIQSASLLGSYFISFILILVNAYAALAILALIEGHEKKRTVLRTSLIVISALLVFNYGYGIISMAVKDNEEQETVRVAVVQGNIDSSQKWDNTSRDRIFDSYEKYTLEAAAEGTTVVILPETALPYELKKGTVAYSFASSLAKRAGVMLLVGAFNYGDGGEEYNAVYAFDKNGEMSENIYRKRHLVPFGEYVPFRSLVEKIFPPLAELILSGSDLTEGEAVALFELDGIKICTGICYDAMYEDVTLDGTREGAVLYTVSSNDSWFGGSAYNIMHNAQISLRSVECGRYSAHAASTGNSAIIDDCGRILGSVGNDTEGYFVSDIELCKSSTIYGYIGNSFVYACIFVSAVGACLIFAEYIRVKREKTVLNSAD